MAASKKVKHELEILDNNKLHQKHRAGDIQYFKIKILNITQKKGLVIFNFFKIKILNITRGYF